MGTQNPSELVWNSWVKPLFTTARRNESPEEAAKRKGAALGVDDTEFAKMAAEQGIEEARRHNAKDDKYGPVNKPRIQPPTILEAYQRRQYAQKAPSDKSLTPEQRNRIYQNQLGQTTFANAA